MESLKNAILVMDASGLYFPYDATNELWKITWKYIDPVLPKMCEELFPNLVPKQPVAPQRSPAGDPTVLMPPATSNENATVHTPPTIPDAPAGRAELLHLHSQIPPGELKSKLASPTPTEVVLSPEEFSGVFTL
jgi:hypothetical protein